MGTREMKDSGIEWIGEIPKDWEIIPMKSYFYMKGRIGWQGLKANEFIDEGPYLVTGTDFCNGSVNWNTCYHISEERYNEAPEIHVQDGDILITKDGTIGKLAFIKDKPEKVSLNSHLLILRPLSKDIENRYIYFALQSPAFEHYTGLVQSGTTMSSLSQEKIGNYKLALPSLLEQRRIATFLDEECKDIYTLITLQEEMITELQAYKQSVISEAVTKGLNPNVSMKDSGVEWIGEIPEHWILTRLKYFCKVNGRVGFKGYSKSDLVSKGEGALTLGGKHIAKNKIDLSSPDYITWEKYYESPEIMVNQGDIVTAQRGTLGKAAIISDNIGKATINPSLVLLNDIKMSNKFLYWFLISSSIQTTIELLNTATAVPMISQTQIGNLLLSFPPLLEQRQIADYLDAKCSQIDELIALKQQKITELQDYKKSLIYEYVTGKKEVPANN